MLNTFLIFIFSPFPVLFLARHHGHKTCQSMSDCLIQMFTISKPCCSQKIKGIFKYQICIFFKYRDLGGQIVNSAGLRNLALTGCPDKIIDIQIQAK